MKYIVLVAALSACASASELFNEDAGEGRLLFNTNSTSSSIVPDYRAVVAMIAIGLVLVGYILRTSSAEAAYDRNAYGQGYAPYAHGPQYDQQGDFSQRYGISHLATKMSQLEHAFKKFEVESEECQMFVACEAAQLRKLEKNVPVVRIVNGILSGPGDYNKMNPQVMDAFEFGQAEHHKGNLAACAPLRAQCYKAHNAAN